MAQIDEPEKLLDSPAFELASRQASLAFERTLVTIEQSLMATIRTSLSLIGFGFAMFWFFHQIGGEVGVNLRIPARNFGFSLVALGVALITIGMLEHRRRFANLKAQMDDLHARKLLAEPCSQRHSPVSVLALMLLVAGVLVMFGVAIRIGPFG